MTGIAVEQEAMLSDTLHAPLMRGFEDLASELGGDAATIARDAGLETMPPQTYRALTRLLEAAAATLGCPDFGLRLARRQGGGNLGPLSQVMRHSRTLGDALFYVAGHSQAHSFATRIWIQRRPMEKAVFVGHDILLPGPPGWPQAMEQLNLLGHLTAQALTAAAARVRCVHFRHQPLSSLRVYRRYFGCDVRFGRNEDGILFHESDFASPVVDADADAHRAATAYIETRFPLAPRPIHVEARGHVMRLLGAGPCGNADIAARLALHPRTLHRRLEIEGTSFQRIKDEVRRDMMVYYLTRTELDLAAVSERLGFAEQAVMTRFCRRLFARSPSELRVVARSSEAAPLPF